LALAIRCCDQCALPGFRLAINRLGRLANTTTARLAITFTGGGSGSSTGSSAGSSTTATSSAGVGSGPDSADTVKSEDDASTSSSIWIFALVIFLVLTCIGVAAMLAVWQRKKRALDKGGRGGHTNAMYAPEGHPARPAGFGEYQTARDPNGLVDYGDADAVEEDDPAYNDIVVTAPPDNTPVRQLRR